MALSSGLLWSLLLINLVTLGAILLDKAAAEAHSWRMSELTIFFLSLIGGVWGTIVGMFLFRYCTIFSREIKSITVLSQEVGRSI